MPAVPLARCARTDPGSLGRRDQSNQINLLRQMRSPFERH
jgi:hypothetical protein